MALQMEELISHSEFVRELARCLVLDEHTAQDVTQQAFLAALEKPPTGKQPLCALLHRVTRNLSARSFRVESRRIKREKVVAPVNRVPSTQEVVEREEIRRCVVEAVLRLNEPYRAAILLRFYEDLSHTEAAHSLGIPLETLRTHLKRGLQKMRNDLDQTVGGDRQLWLQAIAPIAGLQLGEEAAAAAGVGIMPASGLAGSSWVIKLCIGIMMIGIGIPLIFFFEKILPDLSTTAPVSAVAGPSATCKDRSINSAAMAPSARVLLSPERNETAVVLRGKVFDSAGRIVEGARIYVLWNDENTASKQCYSVPGLQETFSAARLIETDWDGVYVADFTLPRTCYICLYDAGDPNMLPHPAGKPSWQPWQGKWVELPAEGVDFTARIIPFGTAVVSARDETAGEYLKDYKCSFLHQVPERSIEEWARGDQLMVSLPIDENKPTSYEAIVSHPAFPRPLHQKFTFTRPGEVMEIRFCFGTITGEVNGMVLNADGNPVEGALVYIGNQIRMRGDEPFKPFREDRIKDGVRTDLQGRFTIKGVGKKITIWHPAYSPVTILKEKAEKTTLPHRGAIHCRLLDEREEPMRGIEVTLDKSRKTTSDHNGCFCFENVEAGIRGLLFPDNRYVGIHVSPGKTVETDIGAGIKEISVEFFAHGKPIHEAGAYCFVGLDDLFTMHIPKAEGNPVCVTRVIPGRYLAFTPSGLQAEVVLKENHAVVDLGEADLTVHAEEGTRIYVVPEGVHELAILLGGRIGTQSVGPSGKVSFNPLPEGRHHVCIDRQGVFTTVEVMGSETEITLGNN
ncbi:MAG: sigma-70 family RNA polymerase sigma factor [Planctomycetota bacterium]